MREIKKIQKYRDQNARKQQKKSLSAYDHNTANPFKVVRFYCFYLDKEPKSGNNC